MKVTLNLVGFISIFLLGNIAALGGILIDYPTECSYEVILVNLIIVLGAFIFINIVNYGYHLIKKFDRR